MLPARHLARRAFSSSTSSRQRLEGKVAIVTASTDGIGYGIARRLALDGCRVMISSRKEANVARAVSAIRADVGAAGDVLVEGVVCHVAKADHRARLVRATLDKFGAPGIDILVSNAAANPFFGPTMQCSEDAWDKIFEVNVKGSFLMAQAVLPHMLPRVDFGNNDNRDGPAIVFVASIAGYSPMPMLGPYSVSKTALLGLTKTLSAELAPEGVRVNCIAPGVVDTKFASAIVSNESVTDKMKEILHVKRVGAPDDIAGVASFLCSADAAYITGETIVAAGGMPARL